MGSDPLQVLDELGVTLVSKSDSRLMRLLGALLFWNDDFMTSFWTVVTLPGFRRIYYPAGMDQREAKNSTHILWHEIIHVFQADGPIWWLRWPWNISFSFLYTFAWLPIGLAYFRMRWETDAYAVGYVSRVNDGAMWYLLEEYAQWVADSLATSYGWAWPRTWSKARFLRRVAALRGES